MSERAASLVLQTMVMSLVSAGGSGTNLCIIPRETRCLCATNARGKRSGKQHIFLRCIHCNGPLITPFSDKDPTSDTCSR